MTELGDGSTGVAKDLGTGAAQIRALKGVDLSLRGGELTLLMGPSGSGKTTLLSILGCMLTPTEGTVRVRGDSIAGKDPEDLAKLRRENIGFVFQSYHLFPTLTAADNVRLALDVRGETGKAREEPNRARRWPGSACRNKSANYPRELSGGEQQRVAIARAVVGDPSVILADEPTAALDSENGKAIMTILAEIAKDPAAACWSSPTIRAWCRTPTGSSISRTAISSAKNPAGRRGSLGYRRKGMSMSKRNAAIADRPGPGSDRAPSSR